MKKARAWLDQHAVAYTFHEHRSSGITRDRLLAWSAQTGWGKPLNRAGTTFRKLPEADRADLDQDKAVQLMLAQPAMIRCPVLEAGDRILVGFQAAEYAAAFR